MKRAIVLSLFIFLLVSHQAIAGGGRISIHSVTRGIAGSTPANVSATVYIDGGWSGISANERVEFRIDNPRLGDTCRANSDRTDTAGLITGTCSATAPGTISIFVYSLDRADESSRYLVDFDSLSTPLPTPRSTPTPLPTKPPVAPVPYYPNPTPTPKPQVSPLPTPLVVSVSPSPDATTAATPSPEGNSPIIDDARPQPTLNLPPIVINTLTTAIEKITTLFRSLFTRN